MSLGKVLLIGAFGVGAAALFMHSAKASSSSTPPPTPGPGATVEPPLQNPLAGTGMPTLTRTSWHVPADATGQQAGTMILTQNAANPNDWALAFRADANGGVGILGYSPTPNGGLLAQAAAGGQ